KTVSSTAAMAGAICTSLPIVAPSKASRRRLTRRCARYRRRPTILVCCEPRRRADERVVWPREVPLSSYEIPTPPRPLPNIGLKDETPVCDETYPNTTRLCAQSAWSGQNQGMSKLPRKISRRKWVCLLALLLVILTLPVGAIIWLRFEPDDTPL